MELGVLPYVFVKRFQVVESLRLGDRQHLRLNFRNALDAKLVNLVRAEVSRRLVPDREAISRRSIGQGPDAGIEPSMRCVIIANKFRELRVRGRDFVLDRSLNGRRQPLAIALGN